MLDFFCLRSLLPILIVCLLPAFASGQYLLSGTVTNDIEQPLASVSIRLQRNDKTVQTDTAGNFKIASTRKTDTIICKLAGYDSLRVVVQAGEKPLLQLWPVLLPQKPSRQYLSSLTRNLVKDPGFIRQLFSEETYRSLVENGFVNATRFPSTGFVLNVNKASYSNIRRFINSQTIMPSSAIRIEEMLNYFSLNFTSSPTGKAVFSMDTRFTTCPWNIETVLLYINVQARKLNLDKVPPGNLIFLIDDSGSMDMPNRLPLVQSAFKMMVANLRLQDTVTIVTYGGTVGVWLPPTGGADKQKLNEAIETLVPGGTTPGTSGLRMAYQMAEKTFKPDANNRVILATDGDFNVGIKDDKELEEFITRYRNSGIYLTCLGVGMGNYKDSKLETLARYGKGNFAYLDNEQEAQKVLVKEFTQTAITVANDVLLTIDFDPDAVKDYRLIGFDNSQAALADTTAIIQGGDIGSGHSLIAMFEIKPKADMQQLLQDNSHRQVATMKLQYHQPGKRSYEYRYQTVPLTVTPFSGADSSLRFAASVSMFGQLLRQTAFSKSYGFEEVENIAMQAAKPGDTAQQEFVKLIGACKKLYNKEGNKKKKKT